MRIKQRFTVEELEQIGKSKHRLTKIELLEQHLKDLYQCLRDKTDELAGLGYRGNKLSKVPGNGCKPRRCSTARDIHIDATIDEQKKLIRKIEKADTELTRIVKTLHKMPTKLYSEILVKKYITKTKTTQRDRDLRRYHLDDALLEYYHTWHR